ncbi:hypothetical protein [Rhodoblastus sp.]|uniref:hypothetical protein n=1 Tax=Rhodoblastus sp. TaxID=1962975 RepID=UPI002616054D|nr:hypothetical protein [Rhodoblastus sp.]
MRRLALIGATALFLPPLAARAGNSESFCSGVGFADTPDLVIGRIKTDAGKVFFRKNGGRKSPCPSVAPQCQDKAYLVPGDLVVLGGKRGDFVCVDYDDGKGSRGGWLPSATLEPAPLANDPAAWVGGWKRVEADIAIEQAKDGLRASGEATYGALDPERVKRGAINSGSFSGPLALKNGQGRIVDDDSVSGCNLKLVRSGDFLFVRDNDVCGGMNVSFSGLYRKAAP